MTQTLHELRTERYLLRIAGPDDAKGIAEFQTRNAEHVRPWFPTPPEGFYTERFWQDAVARDIADAESQSRFRFWAFDAQSGDGPAAMLHVRNVTLGDSRLCEIGYLVDVDHTGLGLATELAARVVRFCFEELRLHRIEACYMPANAPSERVLTKLGFEKEGVLRGLLRVNGVWQDHVLASLLNPQDY